MVARLRWGLKGFQQVRQNSLNLLILPTKDFANPCQRPGPSAVVDWLGKLCKASKQPAFPFFWKVPMNKLLATLAATLFVFSAQAQTAAPAAPAPAAAPMAAAAPEAAPAPQAMKATKTHKAAKSHKKTAKKKAHKAAAKAA